MTNRPRTPTTASRRPGSLLALLLAAFGAGCGAADQTSFTAHEDLTPQVQTEDFAPAPQLESQISGLLKTGRFFVCSLGDRIVFDGLDLPPDATVAFRVLPTRRKPFRGQSVEAHFIALSQEGERVDERDVSASFEPGQTQLSLTCTLAADERIARVEVQLAAPGVPDGPAQTVALVRPVATYPRERIEPTSEPRQVILVTMDTLRRDHLPTYGNELVQTPRIDALADESVVFEDCYSAANVTNPSHFSIFSSLHPKDHGVVDNFSTLPEECPLLMDRLEAEGLATAGVAASDNFLPGRSGIETRFQDYYPCRGYWERRAEDVNLDVFHWLGDHHAEDFFLWVHYFDPHVPYAPPYPYDRMYEQRGGEKIERPLRAEEDLWMYALSDDLHFYENMYMGEISYLDRQFGELLDFLQATGVYDRSLIVVVADHGEALGEHGVFCDHAGLYEATTAVPLIIKTPGQAERGRVAGLVSTLDVYPTVLDYLGLEPDSLLRGRSLAELMKGSGDSEQTEVFSHHAHSFQVSVRAADHRAVLDLADAQEYPRFGYEEGRLEFFSVPRAGDTERDITPAWADRADEVRTGLLDFLADSLPFQAEAIEDPEYIESLRKLGYVK